MLKISMETFKAYKTDKITKIWLKLWLKLRRACVLLFDFLCIDMPMINEINFAISNVSRKNDSM